MIRRSRPDKFPKSWIAYSWKWPCFKDYRVRTVYGTVKDINEITRLMEICEELVRKIGPGPDPEGVKLDRTGLGKRIQINFSFLNPGETSPIESSSLIEKQKEEGPMRLKYHKVIM